ncbi:uncharacterized protein J4E87_002683 [Alternaria ethzedia]|uniref:uncharacterized protein n=1 Tax=Alternaria ethzedia TaxID=181014 RepID=UPI0020C59141|nr:uncharacterized protein J4E87_002683 [Alternaria ethzedia]KAI4631976.1 hypothetical protein J4E87_002683 [Alternaria ethzedia]
MDLLEDQSISIKASLKRLLPDRLGEVRYSLDFDLNGSHNRIYLLKETKPENRRLRTPRSLDTSSEEVFGVAQGWMKQCKCANFREASGEKVYPKRLLDIGELRSANGIKEIDSLTIMSEHGDVERKKVYLRETSGFRHIPGIPTKLLMEFWYNDRAKKRRVETEDYRYVTLSHCWGKPKSVQGQLRLDHTTEERFKRDGIELRELPKTFRDAILFASRLDKVGFIWIDSMCIIQPTENYSSRSKGSLSDWLEQSRQMDQIYRGSFLNISATAATDGDQGLFFSRRPEYLWEDEINVNYTGTNLFGSVRPASMEEDQLIRCTIIDLSFWNELVEEAPVNRRGWVFQERLMAPRVLHFCRDQIAWECAEFEDAEGHPEMNLTTRARQGTMVDEGRFKDLTAKAGKELRRNRLQGLPDPDEGMSDLYIYELWKHVVEVYSKTQLTVSGDKLIALSGIARRFSEGKELFTEPITYIAGLWKNNIESQLLWQVNELYRDGVFENPGRRDATRAPSFSWASIDTPHGITYPDVTDYGAARVGRRNTRAQDHREDSNPEQELMLEVLDHHVILSDADNEYGMVDQGMLLLQPRYLRAIELRRLHPPLRVPYSWRLKQEQSGPEVFEPNTSAARPLEHANLYLDAPESDVDIFRDDAKLYCMPVAYGERTVRKPFRYLYCLLLKYEGKTDFKTESSDPGSEDPAPTTQYPMFRRIGITKLSNHLDEKGQQALKSKEYNTPICLC